MAKIGQIRIRNQRITSVSFHQSGLLPSSLVMGRDGSGGVGGGSASDREQAYRRSMQKKNKKTCSARGLCHSDTEGKTRIFGRRRKND